MGVRDTDAYFHVDMTNGSYRNMKSDATTRHKTNFPLGELSIVPNLTKTEAIVKVRGGKDWTPSWLDDLFVKRTFTKINHSNLKALLQTPAWKQK